MSPKSYPEMLERLLQKKPLGEEEMTGVIEALMEGHLDPAQAAAFLVALRAKGETAEELAAAAKVMRAKAQPLVIAESPLIDTCGTGGGLAGTFNISTAVAFIAAAGGVKVAKHGNRTASGRSGSADVLERLGANLKANPLPLLQKSGVAFLFAPFYHTATKNIIPVRNALGIRTLFNLLGPLTNPAGVKRQVVGVSGKHLVPIFAKALLLLGVDHAIVVYADDGLDEFSLHGRNHVAEIKNGAIEFYELTAQDFDLPIVATETLMVRDVVDAAHRFPKALCGEIPGVREVLAVNAAAALYVAGVVISMKEGVTMALDLIHSGKAHEHFLAFIEASRQ